ncbi:hypothetical protein FOXG_16911 [Fusarium oxysporum f. sp. lycopersici 4287]|uniref:F-box domain-containing protein n=1 Tax=Fusarium oxysporum f. sp. lycopersici (strain 4287 / CBS 123668 / FGSC 9935 / NRRL 34936) TaxID=426428 RepID=A0A0J9W8Y2_FUSO4|nr:hypothetical protein FOXG_16911 [Fusarium oxysporum f. sp. lycopersici 4287]KNB19689.1 hypothetical protein FOXG_16911 [Fusarium oxysporum f. sp. lycopersici 4287]
MAALDTLPIELITHVASYLSPQYVKTLSRTNWFMRHAVVGVLFRTLYIPCPLASTRALEELIHKYQNFISRVHLHVYFQPNMEEKPHDGPMPSVWGAASTDTLKRIVRGDILSNVSSFVVEFNARNFEHDGWWGETASWSDPNMLGSIVDNEDNWDQTLQQETRDYMANASAWETPEWESFLGRLQVLEIGVFGGEDGDCWHTKPEFAEFIGNLPHFVMRHARNVRHLTLEASPDGLFGGASTNYCIPLPLKEDHFLFLHSLTLKNIMIGPELVEFLTSRVDSFEELELYDCMCDGPDWEYGSDRELDPVTWAGLWKAIRESNIRLFKVSVVQSRTPPLMWREGDRKEFETIEDSVEAARIRKMLEEDTLLCRRLEANAEYKAVELAW